MRFQLLDNEHVDLDESYLLGINRKCTQSEDPLSLEISELYKKSKSHKQSGIAVFNQDMQVLPMVSDWLSIELSNLSSVESIKTFAKNITYLLDYLSSLPLYKNKPLDSAFLHVQKHTIENYFVYLKNEKGLATTTIRNRDATYRDFFNYYLCKPRDNGNAYRDDNPYEEGYLSSRAKSKLVEMCNVDELVALMMCAHSESERVLLQFMFDSGVRRLEVLRVTKSDIEKALNIDAHSYIVDDHTILVPSQYTKLYIAGVKGKKREVKPRYTLPSINTLARLKRYFSSPEYRLRSKKYGSDAPAFLNSYGAPYKASTINKLLHRLSIRALKKGLIKRAIHPHMLRHGFSGSLLRSKDLGIDAIDRLITLQYCLGHSQLQTTSVYTQLPYDIYGQIINEAGEVLCRADIMELVSIKTKKRASMRRA